MAEAIRFSDFYPVKDDKQQPQIQSLPIEQIKTSPNQSRRYLYDTSLDSLVKSIREVGVLQPITVRKMGEAQYELVCGERRLRAARLAGQTTIPAILRSANDGKSALLALTENLQRQDLHFLEEAAGIQSLIQEYGLTQEEAARKLGKSQSAISNKLRLLRLSEPVKKMILTHHLTERHARALLRIPQEQQMLEVVHRVVVEELNVKKTEELVSQVMADLRDQLVQSHDQKVKRSLGDLRLITNSVKQTVQLIRQAGIKAAYEIEEEQDKCEVKIHIELG